MALLDLDKIIIDRTIVGINCRDYGGNMVAAKKRSITSRIIQVLSFGTIHPTFLRHSANIIELVKFTKADIAEFANAGTIMHC